MAEKLDSNIVTKFLKSPKAVFLLLALTIMGPLLLPGHILALDSPLAINWDIRGYIWGISDGPESVFAANYNSAPIAILLKGLGKRSQKASGKPCAGSIFTANNIWRQS